MPFKSNSQRRWAHTKTGEKALGGKAAVHEWDEATKGKKLPEKVGKAELQKALLPANPPPLGSELGSTLGTQISQKKNPMGMGKQGIAVKTPKAKQPANAFAPQSVFFKSEEDGPKHPNLRNLWDLLNKSRENKVKK